MESPARLIHYHVFKNAGTSVDRLLRESFGEAWVGFDPVIDGGPPTRDDLVALIAERPALRAISTHSTSAAWSGLPDLQACPILLLRHPIDRVRSVYEFGRRIPDMPDHPVARDHDFRGYVNRMLDGWENRIVIANYQVVHLSESSVRDGLPIHARPVSRDLDQAKRLLAGLPVFGLVRRFEESMRRFQAAYGARFPELDLHEVRENASSEMPATEAEAIAAAEEALGPETTRRLRDCNELDLELYAFARRLFDQAFSGANTQKKSALAPDAVADRFP